MTFNKPKCKNLAVLKLIDIINKKSTNLCFSCDLTTSDQIIDMVDKTHVDIVQDFDKEFVRKLNELKTKHNFMVFEDRKFTDIGNTVKMQYKGGIYRIVEWSDFVNCNMLAGEGVVLGLVETMKEYSLIEPKGLIIISDMSSDKAYKSEEYTKLCLHTAHKHSDYCVGFISGEIDLDDMLTFTPGINLSTQNDSLKQCYKTPEQATSNGSDILIVGRGIYNSEDPVSVAKEYKTRGWNAYLSKASNKN